MRGVWLKRAALFGVVCVTGCGSQSGAPSDSVSISPGGDVAPASTENLPLVDHPEYASWSRFPVGSGVVRKKEVTNEFGVVRVTTTVRLTDKTAEKVVVQSQVTVDRPGNGLVENPPQEMSFPAKFRLPAGMKLEHFALPSLKAKQIGDETPHVCGRDYASKIFTWDERNETGPMTVRLWRSDDVPGRMLRQEINGHQHSSFEEVVEIIQPAGVTFEPP
jgi:hypothetical protein